MTTLNMVKINEEMKKVNELIKADKSQKAINMIMNKLSLCGELTSGSVFYDFESKLGNKELAEKIDGMITGNIMHGKLIKKLAKKDFFLPELFISKQGELSYRNINSKKYYYLEEVEYSEDCEYKVSEITKDILEKLYIEIEQAIKDYKE